MIQATQQGVLRVLYELARDDRPADLAQISAALGISCVRVDAILSELERAGLVDGDRVRLTMTGLVLAVSGGQGRRRAARGRRRRASRAA